MAQDKIKNCELLFITLDKKIIGIILFFTNDDEIIISYIVINSVFITNDDDKSIIILIKIIDKIKLIKI
jgi:hypothetical protein